jgi:heptosyltransferase-1
MFASCYGLIVITLDYYIPKQPKPMNILIVKTSSMGDIIHTLPALTDAMSNFHNISFDWVVEEDFSQIPSWHPAVQKVLPIAIRRWRRNPFSSKTRKEYSYLRQCLKSTYYDIIIDAQGLIKSSVFVTWLAQGIKHGQNRHSAREPIASLFYHHCHYIDKSQHAIERNRELFAKSIGYKKPGCWGNALICPYFFTNYEQLDNKPYLLFIHSTSRKKKYWPLDNWRRLAGHVNLKRIHIKLLWHKPHEYEEAKYIAGNCPHIEILPKLELKMIAHQILGAKAIVSVDTGLSHLAASLNCPNITLFGPTNPKLVGDYGKNQYTLIAPNKELINLDPDLVVRRLQSILANSTFLL